MKELLRTIPHNDILVVTVKRSVIVTCANARKMFILCYQDDFLIFYSINYVKKLYS